jgi:hypothetical protein
MVTAEFQPTAEHPVPKRVKKQTILDRRIFWIPSVQYRDQNKYVKLSENTMVYNT